MGSSKKITLGSLSSCRATTSRRFCPPLSPGPVAPPTTVSARSDKPVYQENVYSSQLHFFTTFSLFLLPYHSHHLLHPLKFLPGADMELHPCCQSQVLPHSQFLIVWCCKLQYIPCIADVPITILFDRCSINKDTSLSKLSTCNNNKSVCTSIFYLCEV